MFSGDMKMDSTLWAMLIGLVVGAFGYWFTTFNMQPILRFRNLRNQVLMDFIYYAQVVNAKNLNNKMQQLYQERILANRRASAQLSAATQDLPFWYLLYLKHRGIAPQKAANHLIGYSNTTDYEEAHKLEDAIRKKLGLPKQT
jgi:hypothetical protein